MCYSRCACLDMRLGVRAPGHIPHGRAAVRSRTRALCRFARHVCAKGLCRHAGLTASAGAGKYSLLQVEERNSPFKEFFKI